VQGQLLNERLTFAIEMDSDLNYAVQEKDADPLLLAPMVDFGKLPDPSIIDAF
jgi:hypothetical protein